MSYKDRLAKLNLLPLEYRTDPAPIFKAKADHVDLNHQNIFLANWDTPSHAQCMQI